jgi:hypothetical protein
MNAEERMFISHLLTGEPALAIAVTWAKRLNKLLRRRVSTPIVISPESPR